MRSGIAGGALPLRGLSQGMRVVRDCGTGLSSGGDSLGGFLLFATVDEVGDRGSHEQGGHGADYYTENHCEHEAADGVTAEDEDADEYEQRGQGGHDGTTQGAVQ